MESEISILIEKLITEVGGVVAVIIALQQLIKKYLAFNNKLTPVFNLVLGVIFSSLWLWSQGEFSWVTSIQEGISAGVLASGGYSMIKASFNLTSRKESLLE